MVEDGGGLRAGGMAHWENVRVGIGGCEDEGLVGNVDFFDEHFWIGRDDSI